MKTFLFALLTLVSATSSFAEEQNRTDRTPNYVVISVGYCSASKRHDFINKKDVVEATLYTTVCQEYKSYRAHVTGSFWDQTVTPIAGTEKLTYRLEHQSLKGSTFEDTELNAKSATDECEMKRKLLIDLAKAQVGKSHCK